MKRNETVTASINTVIDRMIDGEVMNFDVLVTFVATCTNSGYAGDYYQPPEGPDFELEIEEIEFDLPKGMAQDAVEGGALTDAEKVTLTAWFEDNAEYAEEIAVEQFCIYGED